MVPLSAAWITLLCSDYTFDRKRRFEWFDSSSKNRLAPAISQGKKLRGQPQAGGLSS